MFPVSSSILAPAAIAGFLQSRYGFSHQPDCRLIRAGINHTYLIGTTDSLFVFRLYSLSWRNKTEILEELRLLRLLSEAGMPVSFAIPDSAGSLLHQLEAPEGMRYGVLFSYAQGRKLVENAPETHRRTGYLMAQMHGIASGEFLQRVTYDWQTLVEDSLPKLGAFLQDDCPELLQLKALLGRLRPELEPLIPQLPQGVVHLDVWFDNLNVDDAGNITLFDFDFCGNGPLALDLAYNRFQQHFLNADRFEENVSALSSGYESLRKLTDAEREALPGLGVLLYVFYLGVQCERFENYSSVFLSVTYLKRYIQMRVLRYAEFCGI